MKISISIFHRSSGISFQHLLFYISPFSMPSYNTWNFFGPRKVLQCRINHKYSCSSAYTFWISHIFSCYTSCYIFLWAKCPRKWAEDIHILNKIDSNLLLHHHKVDSSPHHQNCLQVYCDSHHNIHCLCVLDYNLQEN